MITIIVNAARNDLHTKMFETGSDDRFDDRVAARDELVSGVEDDVGVKLARELHRVPVVQRVERAVHDESRPYGHGPMVLGMDARRVGNAP